MRDNRIFTAAAILLLAIWAGYNLYMSYTSPSYCPMGNHSVYSYSNLLPILLIVILALSLLPRSPSSKSSRRAKNVKSVNSDSIRLSTMNNIGTKSGSRDSQGEEKIGEAEGGSEVSGEYLENKENKSEDMEIHRAVPPDVLSIIRESPGITQEGLRDVTGYSASKISVEVKKLEERGLIRREKYGRTYRIYPE